MLVRKAAASHGMRQWPPRRMDIPANREDPPTSAAVHAGVRVKKACGISRRRFLGAWPVSPDLRHFRKIMAAVEGESFEMSEARTGKP
jgi:hypothetical protein